MRFLWIVVVLGAGCVGGVRSSGEVGGVPVELDGTGAAWVDETRFVEVENGFGLEQRPEAELKLFFSGAVFDPSVDFNELHPAEELGIDDNIDDNDKLLIHIARGDRLAAGDRLEFDTSEPLVPGAFPAVDTFLLQIAPRTSDYPDRIALDVGATTGELEISRFDTVVSGVLRAEVDGTLFEIRDDDQRLTGEIEIRFDLPLLDERLAECNFDRTFGLTTEGSIDPCDLELRGF